MNASLADHEFYAPDLVIEVIDRAPHVFLDAVQDAALELAAQDEEDADEDARRHINPFEAGYAGRAMGLTGQYRCV